jgi:intraflagellar transport protein 88
MNQLDKALKRFEKLYAILRSSPEVIFQIADIYSIQENFPQAMEWFNILISLTPTDPDILVRIGQLYEKDGDKTQAFQYYSEVFKS